MVFFFFSLLLLPSPLVFVQLLCVSVSVLCLCACVSVLCLCACVSAFAVVSGVTFVDE